MDSISYMEPQELAAAILAVTRDTAIVGSTGDSSTADQSVKSTKSFVVIDVRSAEEFDEGHIREAVHLPSDWWTRQGFVDDVVKQYSSSNTVVFHCAQSRIRGPTCARMFLEHMQHGGSNSGADCTSSKPAV